MSISINFDEIDITKMFESIIQHHNKEELIKLLTPIIYASAEGSKYFIKLMNFGKLPEIIQNGTLCKIDVSYISYGESRELLKNNNLIDIDDNIIVTIDEFRGFHEYSPYCVKYRAVKKNGDFYTEKTYASSDKLSVIDDI